MTTRSRKVNGRVVREYVGKGLVGQLAAQTDALERDRRSIAKYRAMVARVEAERMDEYLRAVARLADLLVRASLVAAGCHQHHRGERRGKCESRKRVQDGA